MRTVSNISFLESMFLLAILLLILMKEKHLATVMMVSFTVRLSRAISTMKNGFGEAALPGELRTLSQE